MPRGKRRADVDEFDLPARAEAILSLLVGQQFAQRKKVVAPYQKMAPAMRMRPIGADRSASVNGVIVFPGSNHSLPLFCLPVAEFRQAQTIAGNVAFVQALQFVNCHFDESRPIFSRDKVRSFSLDDQWFGRPSFAYDFPDDIRQYVAIRSSERVWLRE